MNVLVIICDQLRYDALACHGNPYVQTPNIDRLAARSVNFTNVFTSAPVCSPARHSLISGLYPFAHGVVDNGIKPVRSLETAADRLNAAGYRSVHISSVPGKANPNYGFEAAAPKDLDSILSEENRRIVEWEKTKPIRRRTAGPSTRTKEEHKGFQSAERAVQLIEEAAAAGETFHLWVGIHEPHPPFYPPKPFFEKFDQSQFKLPEKPSESAPAPHPSILDKQREWIDLTDAQKRQMFAGYYGLVEMADQFVGMVLDTVARLNLTDDTLIVLTADHGEQMGDHGLYLKFVLREQSVHVPFMIAHPKLAPGVRHELVAHVDLYPTLCDMTGTEIPENIHGRSIRPLLENGDTPDHWREEVISQINGHIMIRTGEWKLNVYDGEPGELFHLPNDPQEFCNLIRDSEYAEVVDRLLKKLEANMAQVTS